MFELRGSHTYSAIKKGEQESRKQPLESLLPSLDMKRRQQDSEDLIVNVESVNKLQDAKELNELGSLISSMIQELKTPLTIISSGSYLVENIEKIRQKDSTRADEILQQDTQAKEILARQLPAAKRFLSLVSIDQETNTLHIGDKTFVLEQDVQPDSIYVRGPNYIAETLQGLQTIVDQIDTLLAKGS